MISRRQLLLGIGLAAAAVGVGGCSRSAGSVAELRGSTSASELPFKTTPGVDRAARGTADLGWSLLRSGAEPNRVIAPSSLAITLGMLAEGATDQTLAGIDGAFGLSGEERSAALGALRQSLKDYDSLPKSVDVKAPPKGPVVHQASQAVVVEGKQVEQQFLDRIGKFFDAGVQQVPLDGMKQVLDSWAAKHTAGLIKESAIEVIPQLVLVLQDAILFAAAWATEFERDDVPLDFHAPGGTQQIKALSSEFSLPWAEGDGWTAARLPYDDALAMDVILPAQGSAPGDLSAEQLEAARVTLDSAAPREIELTMPPCDLKGRSALLEMLAAQGINFDDSVDGIFPGAIVDQFVQQVRLMVSAKGTVGAALTEVAVRETAMAPTEIPTLVVDRPFIMRVLDTRTGWPLFLAVVSDAAGAVSPG